LEIHAQRAAAANNLPPPSLAEQRLCVVGDVVVDERGYEEVGVVVALLRRSVVGEGDEGNVRTRMGCTKRCCREKKHLHQKPVS
jgi:hypothetical protein